MFFNGKKQQLQLKQDDEKMKKFLAQLEQFDLEDHKEEEQQVSEKKSRQPPQEARITEIIPMGLRYETPEKQQDFIVFRTVQKSKKPLEPPYLRNSLLFFKIRNLPSTQIGQKLLQIRYSVLTGSTWIRPKINRQSCKYGTDKLNQIYEYFSLNYDFMNTDWINHHYRLISWKLNSKVRSHFQGLSNYQICLLELEYRYFIENILSLRNTFMRITTGDDVIAGHFVLFISSMEIVRKRIILELSDGWYSIFLISEIDPIHKKMKIGMKLHICNMYKYPIEIDLSSSKIIRQYKFPYMLVATSLNSIKKADQESKLGRQQIPYFLRSIKSSRRGLIPCLDVYIIEVSYLITYDMKKAIHPNAEIDRGLNYNFYLTVVDSLNYFENQSKAKVINILCLRAKLNNYEYFSKGQRVRLINIIQIDNVFKLQFGDSSKGILGLELKQFKYNPILENDKVDLQLLAEIYLVKQFKCILIGSNDSGTQTVEIDTEFFQGIFGQHLVIVANQALKHLSNNFNDQIIQIMKPIHSKPPSIILNNSLMVSKISPHLYEMDPLNLSNNGSELKRETRLLALPLNRRKSLRAQSNSRRDSQESMDQEKKTFRQSLKKVYEETFVKNLLDRSYVRKIQSLSNYQSQLLDDLQMGNDQQVLDIDNPVYNFISKYLDGWIILPQSNFKIVWNFVMLLTCLILLIWLPFKLAFEINYIAEVFGLTKTLIFEPILFSLLVIDALVNCNEAYISKGLIVVQRYRILVNYFKKTAIKDILSLGTILYQLILVHDQKNEREQDYMTMQIFFVIAFGILKSIKVNSIIIQLKEHFNVRGMLKESLHLTKVLLTSLYSIHLAACCWYGIGQIASDNSWLEQSNILNLSNSLKYCYSLHWAAVYLTNVGGSDITPTNIYELVYASFISFCSLILLGVALVTIQQYITIISTSQQYIKSLNIMNNYMSLNKIDFNLQVRIRNYLDYICREEQKTNDEDVSGIVNKLSEKLQQELNLELRSAVLDQCQFVSKNFSQKLLKILPNHMEQLKTIPEQKIISMNDIDDQALYMITKGEVEIMFEGTNKIGEKIKKNVIKTLQRGEYFGFYSFLTGNPRTASVISKGYCSLFKITRRNFLNQLESFPNDKEQFLMLRDQAILSQDLTNLYIKCYSCKDSSHMVNNCSIVHFAPNKDRIIKQCDYPKEQERDEPYIPRKSKFINALLSQKILQEYAEDFMNNYEEDNQNIVIQDEENSESGTRTYSQLQGTSVSRSMSQFSKYSTAQIPARAIDQTNFDSQTNEQRQSYLRKKDQKQNTLDTAGFGGQFNQKDDIDILVEDEESSSQSSSQEIIQQNRSRGQQSPKDLSHLLNVNKDTNKVTFREQAENVQRNTIKRKSTKTSNTAIIYERAVVSMQEDLSMLQQIPPIITQPSMGGFDKISEFRIFYPQFNFSFILKRIKKSDNLLRFSLYTFMVAAIEKGNAIRRAIESTKLISRSSIFAPGKKQARFMRKVTQRMNN